MGGDGGGGIVNMFFMLMQNFRTKETCEREKHAKERKVRKGKMCKRDRNNAITRGNHIFISALLQCINRVLRLFRKNLV